MLPLCRHFLYLFVSFSLIGLCSCSLWKKEHTHDLSTLPLPTSPINTHPLQQPQKPTAAVTETWVFLVDPSRSPGHIKLRFDPKGSLLGPKPAQDSTPLTGQIVAIMTTLPNGQRTLNLQQVRLTNTRALTMPFHWSRLIGSITVNIPVNVLNISEHSFHQPAKLSRDGSFTLPENYFTVHGDAKVVGSGLVLNKAVGKRDVDLTIKKTEMVNITGTLRSENGITTLRVPSAVMRDKFNMEDNMLELIFTGDIVATQKKH